MRKKSIEPMKSVDSNHSIHNRYYICGIDPGGNTGVSFIEVDDHFNITNLYTLTIELPNTIFNFNRTGSRLYYLSHILKDNLTFFKPFAIGVELPFQHRFANAVIQLSQYLSCIEGTIYSYNPYVVNYRYPPKFVKKNIGATGKADKNAMTKAILSKPDLKPFIRKDMTEHEIDATAIAYITLEDLKKFPHKMLMNIDNFNFYRV